MVQLTDSEIGRFLTEKKPLPQGYDQRLLLKPKRGHKERELDLQGRDGSEFRLILRQSDMNPLDFSVILAFRVPKSNQLFRLRRYNGKSHFHTNKLEKDFFFDFHIHTATERYQKESGLREDAFAEKSNRFADIHGAIVCLVDDCAFETPGPTSQIHLFPRKDD